MKRGLVLLACVLLVATAAGIPVYVRPQVDQQGGKLTVSPWPAAC